jgi:molybdopterin converting factor small subunit
MQERCPALGALLSHSAWAIHEEFAPETVTLSDGMEVVLIPPVSGGQEA